MPLTSCIESAAERGQPPSQHNLLVNHTTGRLMHLKVHAKCCVDQSLCAMHRSSCRALACTLMTRATAMKGSSRQGCGTGAGAQSAAAAAVWGLEGRGTCMRAAGSMTGGEL
jgi:hypothetical protein